MKKHIIFVICIICIKLVFAQKYDNTWVFGHSTGTSYPWGQFTFRFTDDTLLSDTCSNLPIHFQEVSASISDSLGNFLFVTNGCRIINANWDTMPNGGGLNNGYLFNWGCPLAQSSLILPLPNSINDYYLFQLSHPGTPIADGLIYSKIDMSLDGGLGTVTDKNVKVITDDLVYTSLSAVKHANGKDWWIVACQQNAKKMYIVLFTELGIKSVALKNLGTTAYQTTYYSRFSSDGNTFVQQLEQKIRIFDFDRCTGEFSNPRLLPSPFSSTSHPKGFEISPNNRFLYRINEDSVFQYDLFASNIAASKVVVAVVDGFTYTLPNSTTPIPTVFWLSQLAPDGKIYIAAVNIPFVSIIHSPDSQGLACNIEQHHPTPAINYASMPHFPNYRLGAAAEVCDTTSSNQLAVNSKQIKVYPNPAQNYVQVELPQRVREATFVLYNALGQVVQQTDLQASTLVRLGNVAKGLYFYEVIFKEGKIYGKLQVE